MSHSPATAPPDLGALLVSLQLTDSAFPSGFYTLSHSLEGFAQAGCVTAETMPELLADLLRHTVGPADATALALAYRAADAGDWGQVAGVDRRLYATKLNARMRVAATRTGRQLLDIASEMLGGGELDAYKALVAERSAPATQAVVTGIVYCVTGVPIAQAVASDLYAFSSSFVGAALRLRLTDHRRAQTTLRAIAPVITEVTDLALHGELEDLGGAVPVADTMSGRHERAEARLFIT